MGKLKIQKQTVHYPILLCAVARPERARRGG